MTKIEFEILCKEALRIIKERCPYDTGNLSINAIRYEWKSENTYVIYVDKNIGYYMPYTNEKWIAPKWKGANNPNEGWWQKAVEEVMKFIESRTRGELKKT